jgi:hypothetical protein
MLNFMLNFMLNAKPISKTLFVVTQLVWFKVSLVRSRLTEVRLAQTLTLRVYPVLPVSNLTYPIHSPGIQSLDSWPRYETNLFGVRIRDHDTKRIHVFTNLLNDSRILDQAISNLWSSTFYATSTITLTKPVRFAT